jgi:hypothetical protein
MPVVVLIDGSNFAFDEAGAPSITYLEAVIKSVEEASVGHEIQLQVIIDAALRPRTRVHSVADFNRLEEMIHSDRVQMAPGNTSADDFILLRADQTDGIVVSNDRYRKFVDSYPWLNERGRKISGMRDKHTGMWDLIEVHRSEAPGRARSLREVIAARAELRTPPRTSTTPRQPLRSVVGRNTYSAQIDRRNPAAVVVMIDQSGSMNEAWDKQGEAPVVGVESKAIRVASLVNKFLRELIISSTQSDGIRDYFDVAVFGYGDKEVRSLLRGTTLATPLLSLSELDAIKEMSDESTPHGVRRRPSWVTPRASGPTPMCAALSLAVSTLSKWVASHESSFPPIVLNVTDGKATDGSMLDPAQKLNSVSTSDGIALLFTAHISAAAEPRLSYPPDLRADVTDEARTMFNISSLVPEGMRVVAKGLGVEIPPLGRGFLFNADANAVVTMLKLGTLATTITV